jgi:hypothetical protein
MSKLLAVGDDDRPLQHNHQGGPVQLPHISTLGYGKTKKNAQHFPRTTQTILVIGRVVDPELCIPYLNLYPVLLIYSYF